MPTQTNEQALEAAIQSTLSGITIEEIKEKDPTANVAEGSEQDRSGNGYYIGNPGNFHAHHTVDTSGQNPFIFGL